MKKFIFAALLLLGLSSCADKTKQTPDSDTKYPMEVVMTLKDTAFIPDAKVVVTDENTYIVRQKANETYVSEYYKNESNGVGVGFLLCIWCIIIVGGMLAWLFD